LVLAVDAGFFPALAVLIAPPLLRSRNRNTPLVLVLALLTLCDVEFHRALMQQNAERATHTVLLGIDLVLILVTVIGGRILPAFTASGLRLNAVPVRMHLWPGVGAAAITVMAALGIVDLFWPETRAAGLIAGIAAVVQGVRLLQWRSAATLRQPILWVLHLAYAWLPLGLALKSAALLGGYEFAAFWLHALTIGALATMILAVMSRAALGHTGRALVVEPAIAVAYVLLLLAALTRVFGLAMASLDYALVIVIAASFWTAAFALFLYVYLPILWGPRADGKLG
jgi:uncharacterized protein involved in response to NO